MKRTGFSQKTDSGFTLAELLIAMGITALIVVMLGQVFSAATAMWQASDQRIDAFRDARTALQLMTLDLGRAHINGDEKMLTLTQTSGSYAAEADAITPVKNFGKSDLCVVEYYLNWNATNKIYALVRRLKDSNDTTAYLANPSLNFGAIFDKTKGTEETLATPVWDLQFRPGETDIVVTPNTGTAAQWKWLEVRFKTMSVNSARKLKSISGIVQATWGDPTSTTYKTLILPYEQQFVTRISLQQNQ